MASIHSCTHCGSNLNLNAAHVFPPHVFFEAGNRGTTSFSMVDTKIIPFFEALNYWGIHRTRTKIKCDSCGRLVGHIYDDGLPVIDTQGQFRLGHTQPIPRCLRYRFKTKSLRIISHT